MIKYLLSFFIGSLLILPAIGQPVSLQWMKQLGSNGEQINGHYLSLDSGKYVYVSGGFSGTIDFDPGPAAFNMSSNGSIDIYIAKFDSAGQFIWAKQIGGAQGDDVRGMKIDRNGHVVLTGYFQGTVDMDPGPGVQNVSAAFVNTFFTKLDADGNLLWSKQSLLGSCNTLALDGLDNIYIGGDFAGSYDFDPGPGNQTLTAASVLYNDMFILKLSPNGDFRWARQIPNVGSGQSQQFGMQTDHNGNIFMCGGFTERFDFDPGPAANVHTSAGSEDCFVVGLDSLGQYKWARSWGSTGTDKAFGFEIDRNGSIYTTGGFTGNVDFDPGAGTFVISATSFRNCFLSKFNQAGEFVFARHFTGNSFGQSVSIDSSDNIYVSGGFYGPVDFDPGPGVNNVDGGNLFVARLNPAGNLFWVAPFQIQIVGGFESIYSALAVDALKNVYYTGIFSLPVDFDPGPGLFVATPRGSNDAVILRLNGGCRTTSSTLNVTTCDQYILNGTTYTNSGSYFQNLTGSGGCDSLLTLNLTITQITTQAVENSCGPFNWNGTIYTASGNYRDTLTAANGCDSIINLTLTIRNIPTPLLGPDNSICNDETIALYPGTFEAYLWNNNSDNDSLIVSAPGTYWVTVTNNGCQARDSIIISPKTGCQANKPCGLDATFIYPVPCRDLLYIIKNNTTCQVFLNVYNELGQCVVRNNPLEDGLNQVRISTLASGVYFYTLHDNKEVLKRGKIMKLP